MFMIHLSVFLLLPFVPWIVYIIALGFMNRKPKSSRNHVFSFYPVQSELLRPLLFIRTATSHRDALCFPTLSFRLLYACPLAKGFLVGQDQVLKRVRQVLYSGQALPLVSFSYPAELRLPSCCAPVLE